MRIENSLLDHLLLEREVDDGNMALVQALLTVFVDTAAATVTPEYAPVNRRREARTQAPNYL
ncbi:MAG: hypothetical protein MJE77_35420 [Proteobacteria bacterium]|nr:hypothetical protein [Pseudomonadota bacterium]